MTQKVPDAGYRVDSGVIQIGEDWPGTFFRGDHSILGEAPSLRRCAKWCREMEGTGGAGDSWAEYLDELAATFEQCAVK